MDCVRNFGFRTVQTQSLIVLVLFREIMVFHGFLTVLKINFFFNIPFIFIKIVNTEKIQKFKISPLLKTMIKMVISSSFEGFIPSQNQNF